MYGKEEEEKKTDSINNSAQNRTKNLKETHWKIEEKH